MCQRFKLDIIENLFTESVVGHWNRLCRDVVESPSLQCPKDAADVALWGQGLVLG